MQSLDASQLLWKACLMLQPQRGCNISTIDRWTGAMMRELKAPNAPGATHMESADKQGRNRGYTVHTTSPGRIGGDTSQKTKGGVLHNTTT